MGKVKSWLMDQQEEIAYAMEKGADSVEAISGVTGITDLNLIKETVAEIYGDFDFDPSDRCIDTRPQYCPELDDEIPF